MIYFVVNFVANNYLTKSFDLSYSSSVCSTAPHVVVAGAAAASLFRC